MLKLLKIILQAMKQLLMYICMLLSTNFIFCARGHAAMQYYTLIY